jgi:hypothetical protein
MRAQRALGARACTDMYRYVFGRGILGNEALFVASGNHGGIEVAQVCGGGAERRTSSSTHHQHHQHHHHGSIGQNSTPPRSFDHSCGPEDTKRVILRCHDTVPRRPGYRVFGRIHTGARRINPYFRPLAKRSNTNPCRRLLGIETKPSVPPVKPHYIVLPAR